jgi:hypothetical protein
MARRTDKSKRERGKQGTGRVRALFADKARVLNALSTAVTMAIIVTVVATMVVARRPLLEQATHLRQTKLGVAFDWPPLAGKSTSRTATGEPATWMNREQRTELETLALRLLTGDPFDGRSLERTRDALRDTGWFAEGPWLKRHDNGVVVISGRWRVPVAAVRTETTDRLVSSGGEVLLPEYPRGRSGLKSITGACPPPAKPGEPWPGGAVQAGLSLLAYLRPMPGFEQVDAVDVSEFADRKRLTVITATGGRIAWGAAPGEFTPGQAPAEVKRRRLSGVYQQFGQLDAGRAVLDVRPEDGVYLQDDGYIARATTVVRK